MKFLGVVGLGVVVVLCSGRARAQAQAPTQDEEMDAPGAPAKAAPPENDAPTAPAAAAAPEAPPKKDEPAPHVIWKNPSPSDGDAASSESSETTESPPPVNAASSGWSLSGAHLALSVERMTSVLGWSKKVTIQPTNGIGDPLSIETTGTDVSFLGAGPLRSASGVPRIAFDVIFDGGFSVGGSISYMTSSGKLAANSVQPGADLPDGSLFLFAPRLGVLISASPSVGFWLRGGFTRTSVTASSPVEIDGVISNETDTTTSWDLTLDPQLVLVAAPRVGITIGALLDVGVSGDVASQVDGQNASSANADYSNTAYGVTAGMTALF